MPEKWEIGGFDFSNPMIYSRGTKEYEYYTKAFSNQFTKYVTTPGMEDTVEKELTSQERIDAAVLEELGREKREAEERRVEEEIKQRTDLAKQLGNDDDYAFGTVIKFNRRFGRDNEFEQSKSYTYAALKTGNGKWYVTGDNSIPMARDWSKLVKWMTTGEGTVENISIAWNTSSSE